MLKVVKMKAQDYANLRRAAFDQFGDLVKFNEWLVGKHIVLGGMAYDCKSLKEEKWSSGLQHERRD